MTAAASSVNVTRPRSLGQPSRGIEVGELSPPFLAVTPLRSTAAAPSRSSFREE